VAQTPILSESGRRRAELVYDRSPPVGTFARTSWQPWSSSS